MKFKLLTFILAASFCLVFSFNVEAKNSTSTADTEDSTEEAVPVPTLTPVPQPTFTPTTQEASPSKKFANQQTNVKALIIHKPMPSPSWGKVIQYHREQIFALTDKNRETLHEFLFQDDEGVVRTAVFHENADGGGYWEVWVWDQQ
jgi:hypothetical protein